MRRLSAIFFAILFVVAARGETVLSHGISPGGRATPIDATIPASAITDADRRDGEISLWISAGNGYTGWTWALPSKPGDLYLTDGKVRSPLLNPANPEWGDLGPQQPGASRELRFALPQSGARRNLRLVCPRGVFVWGGSPHGDFTVDIWKGIRADVKGWVDSANRCGFVDMKDVPAEKYVYRVKRNGKCVREKETASEVFRVRMPSGGGSIQIEVEARTRRDGVLRQTVELKPHDKPLKEFVPPGRILVGQCVYDGDRRFADEIATNSLCNLLVSWNKLDALAEMPEAARRVFDRNGMSFMTIYGHDRRKDTEAFARNLGARYLWNNIGELAGYLYQGPNEAKALGVKQDGSSLGDAKDAFVNFFMQRTVRSRKGDYDVLFSTSGSPLGCYELQGGMDFMCNELFAVGSANLAYATSEARGAARKWKPECWGGWLAEEWQTFPVPYEAPQKYDLLKTALFQQYLMGTGLVVLESGAQSTQAQKYTRNAENRRQGYGDHAPVQYRRTVKEFFDWTKAHPRDKSGPQTHAAFVLGNNDGFVGMCHENFAVWAQHATAATNDAWKCASPEKTWEIAKDVAFPLLEDALEPYPNSWLAGTPYGQVDLVQIDDEARISDISRYSALVYAGWNTMTPRIMKLLRGWVERGGELLIATPHFAVNDTRKLDSFSPSDFVDGGNLKSLVPFSLTGREKPGVREFAVGKGKVRLVTCRGYPAEDREESAIYRREVERILSRHRADAIVEGADAKAVSYAVYSDTVYVLNMDCVKERTVTVAFDGGRKEKLRLAPCEMRILPRRKRAAAPRRKTEESDARFADSRELLRENPGRGAAPLHWHELKKDGNEPGRPQGFSSWMWDIGAFSSGRGNVDAPISDDALEAMRRTLANARTSGARMVLRIAYTSGAGKDCEPGDFKTILGHVRQLGAVVAGFPDVVAALECGMIGPWGEMHSSRYLSPAEKSALVKGFLAVLPPEIPVLVRNPSFIRAVGDDAASVSRLGLYNDGFLGTDLDYGTWSSATDGWSRAEGVAWLASRPSIPYGGELAYVSESEAARVQLFDPERYNIVEEFYHSHLSYLRNIDDVSHPLVRRLAGVRLSHAHDFAGMPDLSSWQGCDLASFVRAHLGYRFVLREARIASGHFHFTLENTGFSIFKGPARVEMEAGGRTGTFDCDLPSVPSCGRRTFSLPLPADCRKAKTVKISFRFLAGTAGNQEVAIANSNLRTTDGGRYTLTLKCE